LRAVANDKSVSDLPFRPELELGWDIIRGMIWTAWSNGRNSVTGAGNGFVVEAADRDQYFKREWRSVAIELPYENGHRRAAVSVDKNAFWNVTCRELISRDIGLWLLAQQHAPWQRRYHPKFEVEPRGDSCFRVRKQLNRA
jgi:hypothetical protein